MTRHKEKDAEAGGEGMGKLQTRKRLWRDSTGAVVAKRRPELEKPKNSPKQKRTPRKDDNGFDTNNYFPSQENEPLSPPGSLQDHISNGPDPMETSDTGHAPSEDLWPVGDVIFSGEEAMPESFDFLLNASWGSKPQEAAGTDLLYNDLFAPDTGELQKYPHFSIRSIPDPWQPVLSTCHSQQPVTTTGYSVTRTGQMSTSILLRLTRRSST